jgi:DNA-dependent protein kinase catalytic subunit
MTSGLGVLEWVPGTIPLKAIIEKQLTNGGNDFRDARAAYTNYYNRATGAPAYVKQLHAHSTKVVDSLRQVEQMLPEDALVRAVAVLSSTPESFLVLRSKFARSFSAVSAASYVLGIGDRHLDNLLLDQTDGSIVNIDFGMAFGLGTTALPVPELLPIRFTRQFQHLLQPLDTRALLKRDMCYIMSALKKAQELLLTMMEVFVKEPTMDWEKIARDKWQKGNKSNGSGLLSSQSQGSAAGGVGEDAQTWYPRKKIAIARRKLNGDHPCAVLLQELKENVQVQNANAYSGAEKLIWGSTGTVRRRIERCITVEEQVECILDLATEPELLGRTWAGWAPFL